MSYDDGESTASRDRGEGAAEACAQCGSTVPPGAGRAFSFGVGSMLCWQCAIQRGGQYDANRDEWVVSPDVRGLPDEAYGPDD